jgi:hypothetical protein
MCLTEPMSFTKKLVFKAVTKFTKTYSIYVSGTSDNSLFSSTIFLQRHDLDQYEFGKSKNGAIQLLEAQDYSYLQEVAAEQFAKDDERRNAKQKKRDPEEDFYNGATTELEQQGFRSPKIDHLVKSGEMLLKWLNFHLYAMAKLSRFPYDVI